MTSKEIDWVAIAALLVSLISLYVAWQASIKAESNARENTNIQHALIEGELRQSLENSRSKVNEIAFAMTPLDAKKNHGTISQEEEHVLKSYHRSFDAAIESMLNTLENACSNYLDGKIDKQRFKKNYHVEIRNVIENPSLREYFDPNTSRYKPILKIYKEWNDHENG